MLSGVGNHQQMRVKYVIWRRESPANEGKICYLS